MVVVVSRSPGVVLLLAAALLLATAVGDSSTICDTAKCGKGTCSEVPLFLGIAGYNCTCDPGWSQPLHNKSISIPGLDLLGWLPCMIPDCKFDSSCYNFSFLLTPIDGIPLTDPCVAMKSKCGSGVCKKGEGYTYSCECDPGTHNFLNQTMLPCMGDCSFGDDCKRLGLYPPAPPPPPSTAPPPGSASSWRLLQQLLSLAILLLLQVVV